MRPPLDTDRCLKHPPYFFVSIALAKYVTNQFLKPKIVNKWFRGRHAFISDHNWTPQARILLVQTTTRFCGGGGGWLIHICIAKIRKVTIYWQQYAAPLYFSRKLRLVCVRLYVGFSIFLSHYLRMLETIRNKIKFGRTWLAKIWRERVSRKSFCHWRRQLNSILRNGKCPKFQV